jgi:hypothetical protein
LTVPVGVPELTVMVAVNVTSVPKTGEAGEKVTLVDDVAVAATVTGTADATLPEKLESPVYWAVIELPPVARPEVTKLATPPETGAVPSSMPLFRNSTVPVGVPPPGLTGLTVAVSVTFWLATGEVGKKVTTVVVAVTATGTVIGGEVLVA